MRLAPPYANTNKLSKKSSFEDILGKEIQTEVTHATSTMIAIYKKKKKVRLRSDM